MRLCYLSHRPAAKAQMSQCLPEPLLLAYFALAYAEYWCRLKRIDGPVTTLDSDTCISNSLSTLLLTFAISLDQDQNVGPDLDLNCLTL